MHTITSKNQRPWARALLIGTAITAVGNTAAFAQSEGSVALEEILITAQKRQQNLQDVGVSVTAFSGNQMRALGFSRSDDIMQQTPGLMTSSPLSGQPSVTSFTIRGVAQNDFADHNEGPNAVYIDQTYVGAFGGAGFQLYDLERVEVLRGPQGTLFGRNATGGLVHFISKKPTEEFEGYIDLTLAEYDQIKIEGAVGGALTDGISARLSFSSNQHDGFVKNRIGPDVNNLDSQSFRAQILFQPSDSFQSLFNFRGGRDRNEGAAYNHRASTFGENGLGVFLPEGEVNSICTLFGFPENPATGGTDCGGYSDRDGDNLEGAYDTEGFLDRDAYGVTNTTEWDIGNVTLTSITDYTALDKQYLEDTDSGPDPLLRFLTDQDSDQFTQELRISGSNEKMNWVAGLYYLKADGDYISGLESDVIGFAFENNFSLKTEAWAVFGQAEYDLSPAVKLIAGARWSEEDKTFNYISVVNPGDETVLEFNRDTHPDLAEQSNNDWSGKLELDWNAAEDVLLYIGATRGFKAGGFNAAIDGGISPEQISYAPEILTSYEAGVKATLFSGRARFNASVFFYDYNDYQAFNLLGTSTVIFNADAEIKGAEIEITASPADGWDLLLGVSLLDAKVLDVTLPSGVVADRDAVQAPDFTLNGLVRKEFKVGDGSVAVQTDFNYVTSQQFSTFNHPTTKGDAYFVGNARVTYFSPDDNWEIAAFVKNITDEDYVTQAFDITAPLGLTEQVIAPPRWAGIQFLYRW